MDRTEVPEIADSWLDALSPELFWDVDRAEVTLKKHLRWIVERILAYGRWEDWELLRSHVTKTELRNIATRLKLLLRERIFLENYLESSHDP